MPVTQNNTVVSVDTVQLSTQEPGNGAAIAIVVSVVVALAVGGGVGYYLYRRYGPKDVNSVDPQMTERERVHQTSRPEASQMSPELFEEQYHPSAGFDIFGKGDLLKSKFNNADHVIEEDEDDDDTDHFESQGRDRPSHLMHDDDAPIREVGASGAQTRMKLDSQREAAPRSAEKNLGKRNDTFGE